MIDVSFTASSGLDSHQRGRRDRVQIYVKALKFTFTVNAVILNRLAAFKQIHLICVRTVLLLDVKLMIKEQNKACQEFYYSPAVTTLELTAASTEYNYPVSCFNSTVA